ncbi:hypothetical protein [Chelativorans alearense]|uniref:hypothetical protein n=1 Tax=Chelativorans alearense TaxID=2681495 RepID=UPI0013D3889B|nr:hypothetical protein [Chelativorans alearense]
MGSFILLAIIETPPAVTPVGDGRLEQFQEKWKPDFRLELRQNKELDQIIDSMKNDDLFYTRRVLSPRGLGTVWPGAHSAAKPLTQRSARHGRP